MPYFNNNVVNILFIHIPKTGGSSIECYFSGKYNIPLNKESFWCEWYNLTNTRVSLQHLTYNDIKNNLNHNNLTIITVVRNPYTRIVSDLFFCNLINITTTKEQVSDIIKNYLHRNDLDNHNIPQFKFIENADNIIILKQETLDKDMHKIGYTDFNQRYNENQNKVDYFDYLNKESIAIINNFYKKDFELFSYRMITFQLPFQFVQLHFQLPFQFVQQHFQLPFQEYFQFVQ